MNCSLKPCSGAYEAREVVHTVRHKGQVIVIERVPAQVCSLCGDVLLTPETVRHLEAMLRNPREPERMVPLYEYA